MRAVCAEAHRARKGPENGPSPRAHRTVSDPAGYAYIATGRLIPICDHLGAIVIFEDGENSSTVEWRQCFNTRYGPLGRVFPSMMKFLMGRAVGVSRSASGSERRH